MNIRRMTLADVVQVVAIDRASFALPWPERSYSFELQENDVSRSWVAEVDDAVAGMIVVWLMVDEAHIATIATHPNHRRKGVASGLLRHALAHVKSEGARSAFLEVRASNTPAQEMYRALGFVETGVRPRYYKDNSEDALLMTLDKIDE